MEPERGFGVVKPINVNPEDVGLHDTDSSELSASTANNSTLLQLEATDVENAQNKEERGRRRVARKEKRSKREEEEGAAMVRREETKKRRKKTQERS